jgi:cytochrome P450
MAGSVTTSVTRPMRAERAASEGEAMELEQATHGETVDLSSLEPAFSADPFLTYDRLRTSAPVVRVVNHGLPGWLVTRYEDVRRLLTDPRLSNDPRAANPTARAAAPWFDNGAVGTTRHMLHADGADHRRLRRLVTRAFTPARIEAMRPRIEEVADELVAAFLPRGRADLMEEFAMPLPGIVVMGLLGVPTEDSRQLRAWLNTAVHDVDDAAATVAAFRSMRTYLAMLIARKQAELASGTASDDLLSALVAVHDEDAGLTEAERRLSGDELLAMVFLLILGALETVTDLIGNGTVALLRSPDQLAAMRADPGLLDGAVEELLRFDGPMNIAILRFTTAAIEVGDVVIPGDGQVVFLGLAAGDHDPARYTEPGSLDVRRDASGHLAFGHGAHACLGAPLGRMEARIAFRTLLRRCPDLAFAIDPSDLEWRVAPQIRGLRHLPVTFTPA